MKRKHLNIQITLGVFFSTDKALYKIYIIIVVVVVVVIAVVAVSVVVTPAVEFLCILVYIVHNKVCIT